MSRKSLRDEYHDGISPKITLETGKFSDTVIRDKDTEKNWIHNNSHIKLHPELQRSDVSIYPSYTGLNCLPYYVICRRRVHKTKSILVRQFNREISYMTMIQAYAIAGVRIDRNFSVGFPPEAVDVPDFATSNERRRINQIINNK